MLYCCSISYILLSCSLFFFNDAATTEIYTLSLHDALPICARIWPETIVDFDQGLNKAISKIREALGDSAENPRFIETVRSEEHTSELQSHSDLVCRLLLEKKKKKKNNDTNVAS